MEIPVDSTPAVAAEVAQQAIWLGIRLEGWLIIAGGHSRTYPCAVGTTIQRAATGRANSQALALSRVDGDSHQSALPTPCRGAQSHRPGVRIPTRKRMLRFSALGRCISDILSDTPEEDAQRAARYEERDRCFVDLLWEIGKCLGFSFNKIAIKRDAYSPIAHGELEDDQRLIRKGIVELLTGKRALSTLSWLMPGRDPLRITTEPEETAGGVAESPPAREQPLNDEANQNPPRRIPGD